MKTWITFFVLGLSTVMGFGQIQALREVIGSEGGTGTNGSLQMQYAVGEAIVSANNISVGLLSSEGFIQPLPLLAAPLSDSVWPGDANHDGIANQYDLLAIGVGYGSTGPARANASLNWTAQYAQDWNDSLLTKVNYKHIDCNGDGMIDDNDTLALQLNFGLTHNKGSLGSSSGPPLYFEILEDSLMAGDTAQIGIYLGQDTFPATNVYGLAFTFSMDTALVDMSTARVSYPTSFMGQKGNNLLTFDYLLPDDGQIALALSGKDQANRNGYGMIAKVSIIMIDDLAGKKEEFKVFRPEILQPKMVDAQFQQVSVRTPESDSVVVSLNNPTAIDPGSAWGLSVYPNPAKDFVKVSLRSGYANGYRLSNAMGQVLLKENVLFQQRTIPLNSLPSGVYLLTVWGNFGQNVHKVVVRE
jgi:hypothetical protein